MHESQGLPGAKNNQIEPLCEEKAVSVSYVPQPWAKTKFTKKRKNIYIYIHTYRVLPETLLLYKFLDVTLKLKPASVLSPLELVSNFRKRRALGMHIFWRFSAKRGPFGAFSGEACQKFTLKLKLKPFRPRGPPRNPGQSVTF